MMDTLNNDEIDYVETAMKSYVSEIENKNKNIMLKLRKNNVINNVTYSEYEQCTYKTKCRKSYKDVRPKEMECEFLCQPRSPSSHRLQTPLPPRPPTQQQSITSDDYEILNSNKDKGDNALCLIEKYYQKDSELRENIDDPEPILENRKVIEKYCNMYIDNYDPNYSAKTVLRACLLFQEMTFCYFENYHDEYDMMKKLMNFIDKMKDG